MTITYVRPESRRRKKGFKLLIYREEGATPFYIKFVSDLKKAEKGGHYG